MPILTSCDLDILGYSTEVRFKALIWLVGLGVIRVGLNMYNKLTNRVRALKSTSELLILQHTCMRHVTPCEIMWCHVMSCDITEPDITGDHMISYMYVVPEYQGHIECLCWVSTQIWTNNCKEQCEVQANEIANKHEIIHEYLILVWSAYYPRPYWQFSDTTLRTRQSIQNMQPS